MNARIIFLLSLFLVPFSSARAAGFTEPPVTFYGKVLQKADGYSLLLTGGQLAWTIQPNGGTAFVINATLSALPGGYSYELLIPVEKVPSGFTLSLATIAASLGPLSYDRGSVTLNGQPVVITSPSLPAG